jgi:hypothetical protein
VTSSLTSLQLSIKAFKYLYPLKAEGQNGDETQEIFETDLLVMTHTMQALEGCRIRIEDNMRVLNNLGDFYKKLPDLLKAPDLSDFSSTKEAEVGLEALHATLKRAVERAQGALTRVGVLEKLTSSRADFVGPHP